MARLRHHLARRIRRKLVAATAVSPWAWGTVLLLAVGAMFASIALAVSAAQSNAACGPASAPQSASVGTTVGGGWVRVGATIDPTYSGGAFQQFYNGGLSYAELGATPGYPNYVGGLIAKALGLPTGTRGLPGGFALLIRPAGSSSPGIRILKSDIGSGQAGDLRYAIDLHPAIAGDIGFGGKGDVEIRAAGGSPGVSTALPVSTVPCAPANVKPGAIIDSARLGPTTDPVPGSTTGRLDMGRDGTTQHFLSPFNGHVTFSEANDAGWNGGGYVTIQSDNDPTFCYYAAEGLTPVVQVGQPVQVGQTIATPRSNPYNGVNGNYEIGRCEPGTPGDTLAHNVSDPRGMVLVFEKWLEGLGVPVTDNPSNAGYA